MPLATPASELNLWESVMIAERKMHGKLIIFSSFKSMALTYSPHLSLHLIATQPILPYPVCYYMKYQGKAKKALLHLQNLVVGSSQYILTWEVSQKAYCRNITGNHEALLSMYSGKLCGIWQLYFSNGSSTSHAGPCGTVRG